MALGTLFLCVIMLTFAVTHVIKYDRETSSVEIAGELALIALGGVVCYVVLYFIQALV